MAVFNKRQVGYIKAIAGVGDHKTFKHSRVFGDMANCLSLDSSNSRHDGTKKFKVLPVFLNNYFRSVDSTDTGDQGTWSESWEKSAAGYLNAAYAPQLECLRVTSVAEGDETKSVTTESRVGEDFYLNATHVKMRFTMPDFGTISGTVQPHHEYRLIIFRNKLATLYDHDGSGMDGVSYLNWNYDLFNGYTGRRIGFQGFRNHETFDDSEVYSGNRRSGTGFVANTTKNPLGEPANLSADDWMTLPLNDTDYVIHTDERFFLGREHGKSHYEKMIRFDWRERGSTGSEYMQGGLREGFNPNWIVLLLATTNDDVEPNLNYLITQTTSVESA